MQEEKENIEIWVSIWTGFSEILSDGIKKYSSFSKQGKGKKYNFVIFY